MIPGDKRQLFEEIRYKYAEEDPLVEGYELVKMEGPHKVRNPEDDLGQLQQRYYATFEDPFGHPHIFSVNFNPATRRFGIIKRSSGKND